MPWPEQQSGGGGGGRDGKEEMGKGGGQETRELRGLILTRSLDTAVVMMAYGPLMNAPQTKRSTGVGGKREGRGKVNVSVRVVRGQLF